MEIAWSVTLILFASCVNFVMK